MQNCPLGHDGIIGITTGASGGGGLDEAEGSAAVEATGGEEVACTGAALSGLRGRAPTDAVPGPGSDRIGDSGPLLQPASIGTDTTASTLVLSPA